MSIFFRYFNSSLRNINRQTIGIQKQSLERWDKFSGREASNHSKVLRLAEEVGNWRSKKDIIPIFELTYDDMRNCNVERIDELQEFLHAPKKDSKTIVENALAKDSVTKVS